MVKERLKVEYVKELFELCPKPIKKFVKNILVLQFDEEPKYDYYIEKLRKEADKFYPEEGQAGFEWIKINQAGSHGGKSCSMSRVMGINYSNC